MPQVYMETVMDLLADAPADPDLPRARLDIKQGPHGHYLPGLIEHQVLLPPLLLMLQAPVEALGVLR